MKEIKSFFYSTLLLSSMLLSFTGYEDKKVQDPFITVENTTEVFTQKDKNQQKEKNRLKIEEKTIPIETSATQKSIDTFTLSDIQQNTHILTISNQKLSFHDIDQSIVVINLFTTWDSSCRGEIPYLSDLQKKYKKHIFIAGILLNDKQDNHALKAFISKNHADYFISNSKQNDAFSAKMIRELQLSENFFIPLTVIFKEGNYYTHYEGAVPVEMIDHDIQEAIKTKGL